MQSTNKDAAIFDQNIIKQLEESISKSSVPKFLHLFVEDSSLKQDEIEQALFDSDFETLERINHTLASSAITFGAVRLHNLCRAVEFNYKEGQYEQAAIALKDLPSLIKVSNEAINTYLESNYK